MKELLGYSMLAFMAGVLLNFVPCVLPVIPLKVRAVLREIKGDIRSRILAALCLLCGSLFFFSILGSATAYLGLTWGALFQSKAFIAVLSVFLLAAAMATFADYNEDHKVLLEKFGGTALPYALVMDGNGNVIRRFAGMFSAKTLAEAIGSRKN